MDTLITCPIDGLDMHNYIPGMKSPLMYDLVGIVNHCGDANSGHYVANAKNSITNKWFNFDDHEVTEIKETDVVTNAAYIFFFIRRDFNCNFDQIRQKLPENFAFEHLIFQHKVMSAKDPKLDDRISERKKSIQIQ